MYQRFRQILQAIDYQGPYNLAVPALPRLQDSRTPAVPQPQGRANRKPARQDALVPSMRMISLLGWIGGQQARPLTTPTATQHTPQSLMI